MGSEEGALAKAAWISAFWVGVPVIGVREGWVWRTSGRRTRAVIVWERERASVRTWAPVRPEAPRRRMRIFFFFFEGG